MESFIIHLTYVLEANIVLFICQFFTILIVLKLIVDKKSASNILAWLLAILFIPYIAIPFFVIFQRKDRRIFWQKVEMNIRRPSVEKSCEEYYNYKNLPKNLLNVFSNLEIPSFTAKNSMDIYTDGVESYNAFIDAIQSAKHNIYIQTYVFKNDTTSKLLISALEKKASEGVEIKLLIDSLGSFYVYRNNKRIFNTLRKLGARVVFFMPIISNPLRNYINFRNHRKIYIIDNYTVFSGGMNIGDEYMSPIEHDGMWEDLLFKIKGESVGYYLKVFCSDWRFATKEELDFKTTNDVDEEVFVQVVPSGPDMQTNPLYSGLITAINSAKTKLWILTPYLIPSADLFQSIILAKLRGVDVVVITPKNSNHKIVDMARNNYIRELLANDVDIYFTKNMMHAKAVLIDDNIAMLGSVNLDNRSLFLNYEIATFVYSTTQVAKLYQWAEGIIKDSDKDTSHMTEKKSSLFVESIIKILTPLM